MTSFRKAAIITALATVATAVTPTASVTVGKNIAIAGVDSHTFKSPQQRITVPSGRHVFFLLIKDMRGHPYDTPEGLEWTLAPNHRYRIVGEFLSNGQVKVGLDEDTK